MAQRLFVRRRDGRIEVRLNDAARSLAREAFARVLAAEMDPDHEWHASLNAPIDPSHDVDDPLATLSRQHEVTSNVELAIATLGEAYLNDAEAWAWLCTLQVALRATITAKGIMTSERLNEADESTREYLMTLQTFLFALADVM
ncbi:MAG: hypothetical protein KGL23_03920 [Acidobacteriota bacterium]|nr:hypothetical protein [Acidobacteriota bacterium]MDE3031206.1 hypothetical protein [Acidobacteriota bacterium]MDE3092884.1 hypothetical protein [Acidobacteriota bacterium]MDE3146563.1 hypothetical protein [Acidobacteriota bacterium]